MKKLLSIYPTHTPGTRIYLALQLPRIFETRPIFLATYLFLFHHCYQELLEGINHKYLQGITNKHFPSSPQETTTTSFQFTKNQQAPKMGSVAFPSPSEPPKPWVETPLIYSAQLSNTAGCNIYLKLENVQPSGSFKSRYAPTHHLTQILNSY